MKMNSNKCLACGRTMNGTSDRYCSYQCEFVASVTKNRFYGKKDLR